MPLAIDRLGPGDLEAALRLSTQAGWNQLAADWQRLLDLSPEGCLVGRLGGAVVATATLASFGRDAHWIGMVLVDEAMRGRGFGSAMLGQVLDLARSRGTGVVGLDATDLGRPVYLKLGFKEVAPIDRWTGTLRPTPAPGEVGILDRSSIEALVALDRAQCGADRSELFRHLLHEPGVIGVGCYRQGMSGFAFLRPGRTHAHVGPIVAAEGADCLSLLSRLAPLAGSSPVLLDSLRSPGTARLLEESGLTVARRLTRMTLGSPQPVLMGEGVRAAVSFEWG
jgi:GNAT superfamily N-acetyltransferase